MVALEQRVTDRIFQTLPVAHTANDSQLASIRRPLRAHHPIQHLARCAARQREAQQRAPVLSRGCEDSQFASAGYGLYASARGDAELARPSRVVEQIGVLHTIGWRKTVQRQLSIEIRTADIAIRCDYRSISRPAADPPGVDPKPSNHGGRRQNQKASSR